MVLIGERPILWHIMKIFSNHGLNDFIICLGYKGYLIKEYFANYFLHTCDVTFDLAHNAMQVLHRSSEPWRVTLIDTGYSTMTGGRLKRIRSQLGDEPFCMTYGDGVSNVNVPGLIDFHRAHGCLATVTAVRAPGRFGALTLNGNVVEAFEEKPMGDKGWINGGYFVLSPKVIDYVKDDSTVWEQEPMHRLAEERQLRTYFHEEFWQCMDTLRDKKVLEELWSSSQPPWKSW
jgi:glucose-1-phosphate cytidylyltransferase